MYHAARLARPLCLIASLLCGAAHAAEFDVPQDVRHVASVEEARRILLDHRADRPDWEEVYLEDGSIAGRTVSGGSYRGRWRVSAGDGVAVVHYDYRGNSHDTESVLGLAEVDGERRLFYFRPDTGVVKGWARLVPRSD